MLNSVFSSRAVLNPNLVIRFGSFVFPGKLCLSGQIVGGSVTAICATCAAQVTYSKNKTLSEKEHPG